VDELWLGLVPVVLGAGKPLFQNIKQRELFEFTEVDKQHGYLSLKLRYKG
jgi:dihydrofolate reductase